MRASLPPNKSGNVAARLRKFATESKNIQKLERYHEINATAEKIKRRKKLTHVDAKRSDPAGREKKVTEARKDEGKIHTSIHRSRENSHLRTPGRPFPRKQQQKAIKTNTRPL